MLISNLADSLLVFQGTPSERREAFDLANQRRTSERQKLIAEQASPEYGPVQRIRMWERLHNLHLPSRPDHPLIGVIARRTALTTAEVRAEQSRRLGASAATVTGETVG